jgi:hypothetical protein
VFDLQLFLCIYVFGGGGVCALLHERFFPDKAVGTEERLLQMRDASPVCLRLIPELLLT